MLVGCIKMIWFQHLKLNWSLKLVNILLNFKLNIVLSKFNHSKLKVNLSQLLLKPQRAQNTIIFTQCWPPCSRRWRIVFQWTASDTSQKYQSLLGDVGDDMVVMGEGFFAGRAWKIICKHIHHHYDDGYMVTSSNIIPDFFTVSWLR